ncbi:ragulator complex protein LAMTOR3-like isoform X5 [Amblyomma americanum]
MRECGIQPPSGDQWYPAFQGGGGVVALQCSRIWVVACSAIQTTWPMVPGLQAIVFTDRDGVPLIKAATDSAPEHALRPGFLATVGMAMSQGNKLGLGKCNKMVSSYSNYQVVSFNRHPVTITLVASSSANTGMILNLEEELNTVSQTLRSVVEAS